MTGRRSFTPRGIPLRVLDQVEKMGDQGWGGGIRRVLIEKGGRYIRDSQVISALRRLLDHDLIQVEGVEDRSPVGGKRKYYRITDKGREVLGEAMNLLGDALYEGFKRRPDMYDRADAS